MFMVGWAVALIIRIRGIACPDIEVVSCVLCFYWCAVIIQESEALNMPKDQ